MLRPGGREGGRDGERQDLPPLACGKFHVVLYTQQNETSSDNEKVPQRVNLVLNTGCIWSFTAKESKRVTCS